MMTDISISVIECSNWKMGKLLIRRYQVSLRALFLNCEFYSLVVENGLLVSCRLRVTRFDCQFKKFPHTPWSYLNRLSGEILVVDSCGFACAVPRFSVRGV